MTHEEAGLISDRELKLVHRSKQAANHVEINAQLAGVIADQLPPCALPAQAVSKDHPGAVVLDRFLCSQQNARRALELVHRLLVCREAVAQTILG
jgi:hypothetical protein